MAGKKGFNDNDFATVWFALNISSIWINVKMNNEFHQDWSSRFEICIASKKYKYVDRLVYKIMKAFIEI